MNNDQKNLMGSVMKKVYLLVALLCASFMQIASADTAFSQKHTYSGHFDYTIIGASETQGEHRFDGGCNELQATPRTLSIPAGAKV